MFISGTSSSQKEDVNDDARPGRPSTSTTDETVEEVKKIVMENRHY